MISLPKKKSEDTFGTKDNIGTETTLSSKKCRRGLLCPKSHNFQHPAGRCDGHKEGGLRS